jgi:hypothetical protein
MVLDDDVDLVLRVVRLVLEALVDVLDAVESELGSSRAKSRWSIVAGLPRPSATWNDHCAREIRNSGFLSSSPTAFSPQSE